MARLFREAYPHLSEGALAAYCCNHAREVELALFDGELCGASLGVADGEVLRLELLAVREPWRRQGIGTSLLKRFEERAAERGFRRVAVQPATEPAARLGEHGYRSIEDRFEKAIVAANGRPPASRARRSLLDRVAYRLLVTLPEHGSPFFPPRGTVDTRPSPGTPLVAVEERLQALPPHPLRATNQLPSHPLFSDARIKETIRRLPQEHVEIRPIATVGEHRAFARTERITGMDGVRAFELLSERPLWINLHHIQRYDPAYRELLEQYLRVLATDIDELRPEVYEAGCFLLLSSGRASVHFHADPDQSFLNQIRGKKRAYVYPASLLDESIVETLVHSGDHDAACWQPEYELSAFAPAHLRPGDSVLLPLYAPHRVENDEEMSVSLSIGFHTRHSMRRSRIHLVNRELRARHLPVSPYGRSGLADRLKHGLHAGVRIHQKLATRTTAS